MTATISLADIYDARNCAHRTRCRMEGIGTPHPRAATTLVHDLLMQKISERTGKPVFETDLHAPTRWDRLTMSIEGAVQQANCMVNSMMTEDGAPRGASPDLRCSRNEPFEGKPIPEIDITVTARPFHFEYDEETNKVVFAQVFTGRIPDPIVNLEKAAFYRQFVNSFLTTSSWTVYNLHVPRPAPSMMRTLRMTVTRTLLPDLWEIPLTTLMQALAPSDNEYQPWATPCVKCDKCYARLDGACPHFKSTDFVPIGRKS